MTVDEIMSQAQRWAGSGTASWTKTEGGILRQMLSDLVVERDEARRDAEALAGLVRAWPCGCKWIFDGGTSQHETCRRCAALAAHDARKGKA